jgi:hypothetical protein
VLFELNPNSEPTTRAFHVSHGPLASANLCLGTCLKREETRKANQQQERIRKRALCRS